MAIAAVFAVGLAAHGSGALRAQEDVISQRQELMKELAGATRAAAGIAKGEVPFDAAKSQEIFNTYLALSERGPALFPEGSDTGKTRALPAIWEDNDAFLAGFATLGNEAKQGLAAQDLDSFKAAFSAVNKACGDCHQTFRRPQ
ncbi:c-type cytochrome [Pseudochelatococcus sp. B33]